MSRRRSGGGGSRTIKLVIETTASNPVARPGIPMATGDSEAPKRRKF